MKPPVIVFACAMSALYGCAAPSLTAAILQPDEKYVSDRKEIEEWVAQQKAELNARCQALSAEAGESLALDLTVDWRDKRIVMDLPQVEMRIQKISLDVPQAR